MTTGKNGLDAVEAKLKDITAKADANDKAVKEIRQAILDKGVSVTSETTLAELANKIREIFTMKTTESSPVGEIIAFMGTVAPEHYLFCDGTQYPIGTYPLLEAFFIEQFGSVNNFGGDGTTTFAVPDLRGEFLRGSGANSHANQGNGGNVGAHQDGTKHQYIYYANSTYNVCMANAEVSDRNGDYAYSISANPSTGRYIHTSQGNTTTVAYMTSRPTNTSVMYCIKYEPTVVAVSEGETGTPLTEEEKTGIIDYILAPSITESGGES